MATSIPSNFSLEVEKYYLNKEKIDECLGKAEALINMAATVSAQGVEVSAQLTYDYFLALRDYVYKTKRFNEKSLALLNQIIELEKSVNCSLRETECIKQAIIGKELAQISKNLNISEKSVRFYLKSGKHKLDAIVKKLVI